MLEINKIFPKYSDFLYYRYDKEEKELNYMKYLVPKILNFIVFKLSVAKPLM